MVEIKKSSENIWTSKKEGNIYKPYTTRKVINLRIVSMIPGDRKVAGCLTYFNSQGGNCGKCISFC
ncbi:hypothetical protein COU54_03085 [Candidatus Pacearchaeota archaeon CG10_big_fil_rev_8_21_14_0_10_31_24]|nr:MAG: hypothetical protein COU54_03085 [Candidatus Pacearchaeota archaeon CG10_big_fil_rev_8_21_14_0_10_31_24]